MLFTHRGLSGPAILQISSYWRPGQEIAIDLLPDRPAQALAPELERCHVTPTGTEGYAQAEATVGDIDTAELSSKTMEAKKVPGLYAIGEAVDVTGWLGGYNFQWAWASGWCAGQAV